MKLIDIKNVGVIGGGLMGHGIAIQFARYGYKVNLNDTSEEKLKESLGDDPLICLATAHPAKFPEIIKQISKNKTLPKEAIHQSIENAKKRCQKGYTCDYTHLYKSLIHAMKTNWELHHKNIK